MIGKRNKRDLRPGALDVSNGKFKISGSLDDLKRAQVLHKNPRSRHLLMRFRGSRFLCGHDERDWFVAAIPESSGPSTVFEAMQALKPKAVRRTEGKLRGRERFSRRNSAWKRQGEWFFVPVHEMELKFSGDPLSYPVMKNEPISRGGGSKPHICSSLIRTGGVPVKILRYAPWDFGEKHGPLMERFSNGDYAAGLTDEQSNDLRRELGEEDFVKLRWENRVRDADVYVKGTVRHPDHATLKLPVWHRVFMNTESRARAMRHVAFLD